jgi:predicted transcriptional regulator
MLSFSLGMTRYVARTLDYLQHEEEVNRKNLRGLRIHHGEVSIAMKELMQRNWIAGREEARKGKTV